MLTRLYRVGILFSLLGPAAPATLGEPQESFTVEDYTRIVADYLEGDYRNAALALAGVPTEKQEPAIEAYRERTRLESHVKSAILLHTEVVMWTRSNESFHIRKARAWMGELDAYRRRSFEKSWFLALGYFYMRTLDPEAQLVLDAAVSVFPEDTEILLALGTWKETVGWMRRDEDGLQEAEAIFLDILQKVPEMPEALVRTGRVLKVLGREEEALRYLEHGLESSQDPAVRFAAFLTSGDIYRHRGELAMAMARYGAGVELDPKSQTGVVALSHALHESGETDRSFEMVNEFFMGESATSEEANGSQEEPDLWWEYSLGHSNRLKALLAELRKEVEP